MDIRPIETEADYNLALADVEKYFQNEPAIGTAEAARFNVLSALIAAYEDSHWPIEAPSAIEGIRAAMDMMGHSQADLAALLGSRSRASELLNEVRPLTMEQARTLRSAWGIPAEILLKPSRQAA